MGWGCRRPGERAQPQGPPRSPPRTPRGSRRGEETCLEVTSGGWGRVGPPGVGGAYGAGRRSGGEGWSQCPLPTRPRCPHACPGGPHIWSTGRGWGTGTCTGRGTGTRRPSTPPTLRGPLPCPPPQGSAPGPGGGGPRPPRYFIYRYISTHAHTRSEGNREDPREEAKPHSNRCQKKAKPNRGGEGAAGGAGKGWPRPARGGLAKPPGVWGAGWGVRGGGAGAGGRLLTSYF